MIQEQLKSEQKRSCSLQKNRNAEEEREGEKGGEEREKKLSRR